MLEISTRFLAACKKINTYKKNIRHSNHTSLSFDMTSFTVALTGKSSVLRSDFFPEIVLDPNANYCCALLDFSTYNSIPNIIEGENNEFKCKYKVKENKTDKNGKISSVDVIREKTVSLPTSAYEIEDILKYLKSELNTALISLTYEISEATSTVQISFDPEIEWTGGTVLNVIGFQNSVNSRTFKRKWKYRSDHIAKITNIDVIRIECDIASGSYINGKPCHTIYQFSHCKVSPGYKFIEVPKHIIYFPVNEKQLRFIQISIVDQDGNLIDFRGEQISCRIHIKKVDSYEL